MSSTKQNTMGVTGRIETSTYLVADLSDSIGVEWDDLTRRERRLVTIDPWDVDDVFDDVAEDERELADIYVAPETNEVTFNTTVANLHEYFARNLAAKETGADANVVASYLGLGDDGSTTPSNTDTDLNNRRFSVAVDDHIIDGGSIRASTFIDSTEGNGETIGEVGLFSGDPANLSNSDVFLLNHSTIATITKDNESTVTIDVTLSFNAA